MSVEKRFVGLTCKSINIAENFSCIIQCYAVTESNYKTGTHVRQAQQVLIDYLLRFTYRDRCYDVFYGDSDMT
jgi:hypothetical protein